MSKQGFYFDNMFRAYPFVDSQTGMSLPEDVIVDFSCCIYSDVGYVEGQNKVWLYSVERIGSNFIFTFASDAVGLSGKYLTFVKNLNDKELSYAFSETLGFYSTSSSVSLASSESAAYNPDSCPEKIIWEGFIVVGNLANLANVLSPGDSMYDYNGDTAVEPALVINAQDSNVRTINIANKIQTTVKAPEGCPDSNRPDSGEIYVYQTCLTGDIKFAHGYSCNVDISSRNNEITFTATVDESIEGQFCGNEPASIRYASNLIPGIKVGTGHEPVAGWRAYSGGPLCDETLKTINGIGGKRLWIVGGQGINLTTDQETYTISVEATLSGLAICANSSLYLSSAALG